MNGTPIVSGKRLAMLRVIQSYRTQHYRGPGTRALCELLDLASTSNINYYLNDLDALGLVEYERTPKGQRVDMATLRLSAAGQRVLDRAQQYVEAADGNLR